MAKLADTFSWKTAALKGVKYLVIFALPMLVNQFVVSFPEVAQLTVGGLLVVGVNVLKARFGVRIP